MRKKEEKSIYIVQFRRFNAARPECFSFERAHPSIAGLDGAANAKPFTSDTILKTFKWIQWFSLFVWLSCNVTAVYEHVVSGLVQRVGFLSGCFAWFVKWVFYSWLQTTGPFLSASSSTSLFLCVWLIFSGYWVVRLCCCLVSLNQIFESAVLEFRHSANTIAIFLSVFQFLGLAAQRRFVLELWVYTVKLTFWF